MNAYVLSTCRPETPVSASDWTQSVCANNWLTDVVRSRSQVWTFLSYCHRVSFTSVKYFYIHCRHLQSDVRSYNMLECYTNNVFFVRNLNEIRQLFLLKTAKNVYFERKDLHISREGVFETLNYALSKANRSAEPIAFIKIGRLCYYVTYITSELNIYLQNYSVSFLRQNIYLNNIIYKK